MCSVNPFSGAPSCEPSFFFFVSLSFLSFFFFLPRAKTFHLHYVDKHCGLQGDRSTRLAVKVVVLWRDDDPRKPFSVFNMKLALFVTSYCVKSDRLVVPRPTEGFENVSFRFSRSLSSLRNARPRFSRSSCSRAVGPSDQGRAWDEHGRRRAGECWQSPQSSRTRDSRPRSRTKASVLEFGFPPLIFSKATSRKHSAFSTGQRLSDCSTACRI